MNKSPCSENGACKKNSSAPSPQQKTQKLLLPDPTPAKTGSPFPIPTLQPLREIRSGGRIRFDRRKMNCLASLSQCTSRCLQILMAPFQVRLQMISFSPLIPCVDENNPFIAFESLGCLIANNSQPAFIKLRSGINHDPCVFLSTSAVVPHRRYATKPRELSDRTRCHSSGERRITDNPLLRVGMWNDPHATQHASSAMVKDPLSHVIPIRRELHGSIKSNGRR